MRGPPPAPTRCLPSPRPRRRPLRGRRPGCASEIRAGLWSLATTAGEAPAAGRAHAHCVPSSLLLSNSFVYLTKISHETEIKVSHKFFSLATRRKAACPSAPCKKGESQGAPVDAVADSRRPRGFRSVGPKKTRRSTTAALGE